MNRFRTALTQALQNPEIEAGYHEMAAELEIMRAIDEARKEQHMSQEKLASLVGKKREAIARLLSAEDINPTLNTIVELLSALQLTADITIRKAQEGEGSIKVTTQFVPQ